MEAPALVAKLKSHSWQNLLFWPGLPRIPGGSSRSLRACKTPQSPQSQPGPGTCGSFPARIRALLRGAGYSGQVLRPLQTQNEGTAEQLSELRHFQTRANEPIVSCDRRLAASRCNHPADARISVLCGMSPTSSRQAVLARPLPGSTSQRNSRRATNSVSHAWDSCC